MTAARAGEAFDVRTGEPISAKRRRIESITWYDFARTYVDAKWPDASPKHRKSTAESLITVTMALLDRPAPTGGEGVATRSALLNYGFNTVQREQAPEAVRARLKWVQEHSRPLVDLREPETMRAVLAAIGRKLTGGRCAPRTAALKRSILHNALQFAVIEKGYLAENPLKNTPAKATPPTGMVDRRVVPNPRQAEALLKAVAVTPRTGPHLAAFFGAIYYAGLRPEEAAALRELDLDLPPVTTPDAFGWILLARAAPENGRQWSDTGQRRHERELKHRPVGDVRRVPCPPELVTLFRDHLKRFRTDHEGRLFRSEMGTTLSSGSYTKLWARARKAALTEAQATSPLARRPYDLRHACVSTWLNDGVTATQVAEWAGHSVNVLLRVYAKCLDGGEVQALAKLAKARRK
ncbi:tyrosine-type recombinase/integrase [Kineosporia rhizophila]|uniref:tyrosine-type recombinase/integrase n=1 Tax=Kineosporia rhizophila TaxID=84633 RepID=UPI001E505B4A|nr:tyrosine-type recombinase/integrase [Kineosporia rhizophila]MCE0536619.1 tyrosine-type recombinase/integrase [Kineosporia rhizophila]